MAYYSEDLIEEVISQNDIVEVISEYVTLKKSGRNFIGLCPFHREKTPSFCVSMDKQIFKCFGCSQGGNVISFIMKIENLVKVPSPRWRGLPHKKDEEYIMAIPVPSKRVADFENMGFGMFIHWGLYSQLGKGEWIWNMSKMPKEEYVKLFDTFTAKDFDARKIAKIAKAVAEFGRLAKIPENVLPT